MLSNTIVGILLIVAVGLLVGAFAVLLIVVEELAREALGMTIAWYGGRARGGHRHARRAWG